MAARGLYKATDGSWRQADARTGVRLLYRLKERERWTLLDKNRAMVVHPDKPPKVVYPDGPCGGDRLKRGCLAGGQRRRLFFFCSTQLGTKGFRGGKGSGVGFGSSLARASRVGRSAGANGYRSSPN